MDAMTSEHRVQLQSQIMNRLFWIQSGLLIIILGLVLASLSNPEKLGATPLCLLVGGLGALLALVRRVPKVDAEGLLRLSRGWVAVLQPGLYGAFMAGVAYLLFMSGILTGVDGEGLIATNLFPSFDRPDASGQLLTMQTVFKLRPATVTDLGQLFVWCFLAGYSESFIVGILGKLEKQGK